MMLAIPARRPVGLRSDRGRDRGSRKSAVELPSEARPRPRVSPAALLAALWLLALAACSGPEPFRPNLLLVTVDTLRPDRLACYGGPAGIGEEICAIGEKGVRYSWVISPSPFSSVAITSMLTSRYPSEHGVTAFASSSLPSSALTLADSLGAGGYTTAAFVANPTLNRSRNLHQGFDLYEDRRPALPGAAPAHQASRRSASSLTDGALAFAEASEAPWFIWVHYVEPRGPYSQEELEGEAELARANLPRGWRSTKLRRLDDHSGRGGVPAYQLDDEPSAGRQASQRERDSATPPRRKSPRRILSSDLLRRYDREIRRVDAQIGRLIAGLDALGRPGVLITADHGEALGEDGYWFAHGHSLGLDQLRVPLVWRPPHRLDAPDAAPSGLVVADPISTLDVAPTLVAAAGLDPPDEFRGVPLVQEAALAARRQSRRLFAEHPLRGAIVAQGMYYSRDRWPLEEPIRDPLRGGALQPLPPRTARLADGPRTPRYRTLATPIEFARSAQRAESATESASATEVAILEAALAEFLGSSATPPGARPDENEPSEAAVEPQ